MITKDNFKLYKSLFDDINSKLTEAGLISKDISDINDYFMELDAIRNYVQGDGNASNPANDPYFLILPLDEGLFKIDANTRKIEIPAEFNRNGVGVQGDELAEIIYFSIDRYFDIIDLYDKEIFIQWETPPSSGAPRGEQGLSVTINKTLSFEPGKVVFGWPITSEITKNPGNVKFAVRFYERGVDSQGKTILTYSFSTLTSTIKINPALDFIIDDENAITAAIVDKNNLIYANLRASEIIGPDFPAVEPTFDYVNFSPADRNIEYDIGVQFLGRALFTAEDDENGIGTISYSWVQKKGNEILSMPSNTNVYQPVSDDEIKNKYDSYYIYDSINKKYTPYLGDLPAEEGITVYKLYASLTPTMAGEYYLVANNEAGRGNNASREIDKAWVIAFAKEPIFSLPSNMKMEEENGVFSLDIVTQASAPDNGILTYQWQKYSKEKETFENILLAITPTLNVSEEGVYRILVTNTKNNDSYEKAGNDIVVSYPPQEIEISLPVNDTTVSYENDAHEIDIIINKPANLYPGSEISYQWYRNKGEAIAGASGIVDGSTVSYTITENDIASQIYAEIKNIYNTFETKTTSPKITVLR